MQANVKLLRRKTKASKTQKPKIGVQHSRQFVPHWLHASLALRALLFARGHSPTRAAPSSPPACKLTVS